MHAYKGNKTLGRKLKLFQIEGTILSKILAEKIVTMCAEVANKNLTSKLLTQNRLRL